jgi:uncharacterized protein
MKNKHEIRTLPSLELRVSDGSRSISGIVAYNSPSAGLPWIETIAPGAFADAFKPDADVLLLRDHQQQALLGRTTSKTLQLEDSNAGLKFTASLPNSSVGNDTLESISRRDLTGVSFGFKVISDQWGNDGKGNITRELRKVALYELSVTSFAAFPGSAVGLRSLVPKELRSLLNNDDADEDDCTCPRDDAGNLLDPSNCDCPDEVLEDRSAWAEMTLLRLEVARRK